MRVMKECRVEGNVPQCPRRGQVAVSIPHSISIPLLYLNFRIAILILVSKYDTADTEMLTQPSLLVEWCWVEVLVYHMVSLFCR